jgi:hypothetical protein
MIETTDFGDRDDRPRGYSRAPSVIWRVSLEAEMRPTPMIVPAVGGEDAPEMRFVDDDHVIETFSLDRADQAFEVRIGVSCRLHRQRAVRHKPFASPIPSIRSVAGRSS